MNNNGNIDIITGIFSMISHIFSILRSARLISVNFDKKEKLYVLILFFKIKT